MKGLKSVLVIAFCIFAFGANAQSKIAHINSGELMEMMPQLKSIQDSLEQMSNEYQSVLSSIEKEVSEKDQYWKDNPTTNPTILELRQKEYQDLISRYQRTQQLAQTDVAKKQEDMLKPVIEELKTSIISVAKEMGYDYVLDSTEGGGLIYGDPSDDLMVAVKKKLGIQ